MNRAIATLFGIGYLKPAPGTWGSAAAVALAWLVHGLGGFPLLCLLTIAIFFAGWRAAASMTRGLADHDPGEIVIDELVGQWIALWPLSAGLWFAGAEPWVFPWPGWIGAFLLFRLFDVRKPWLVGWADRRGDAIGLMLDDVLAGLMAAVVVAVAAGVAHGLLL